MASGAAPALDSLRSLSHPQTSASQPGRPSPPARPWSVNKTARPQSRSGYGPPYTAAASAAPANSPSERGAIRPACGLAQEAKSLLSLSSAQQVLTDCSKSLTPLDVSASALLC